MSQRTSRGNGRLTLPESVKETVDRRTWMSWVGKSLVISLGGGVLARCEKEEFGYGGVGQERPSDPVDDEGIRREEDAGSEAEGNSDVPLPEQCPAPAGDALDS